MAAPKNYVSPPPNIDEHNAAMAKLVAEQKAARKRILDCCDPGVAKSYEDRKTLYEWRVEVGIFRTSAGNTPAFVEKFDKQVVAQNKQDAWAMFCDVISEWPSPHSSEVTITQLKKRTLRADPDEN